MSGQPFALEKLCLDQVEAVARLYRAAYDDRFPFIAGRHTPADDIRYFRDTVFPAEQVWGAIAEGAFRGIVSFREGWVEKLYVLPAFQRQGLGRALLAIPKRENRHVQLWTFQRNIAARRFYEAQGFAVVRETDGSQTEEREPDVLYAWSRG